MVSIPVADVSPRAAAPGALAAGDSSLTVHATVLVYDDFSTPGLVALVRRDPGTNTPMLIMVRRAALTPALLFTAFKSAQIAEQRAVGDSMRVDIRLPRRMRLARVPAAVHPQLAQWVAMLRQASSRDFGKYGSHPAIDLSTTFSW